MDERRRLFATFPGLEGMLSEHPHLDAALFSRRLPAAKQRDAIALIYHGRDILGAKRLLGLQPFMEALDVTAIGPDFLGFACNDAFNAEISALMPNGAEQQRRMVTLLEMTVPRTSEAVGKWFVRLYREQGYELTEASIALLCAYIWFSQNPVTTAGRLVHHAWHDPVPLGQAATEARTFGRWLSLTLRAEDDALPTWFGGCKYGGLMLDPIASAAEAREIAAHFGAELYPSIAEKLAADASSFFIARRANDSTFVGYIEIARLPGSDYLYPPAIQGRADQRLADKLPAAAYHLLEVAHRPVGGLPPLRPRRIPMAPIIANRWRDLFGPYLDAVDAGPLFPLQPDAETIQALHKAIEDLGRVAVTPRQI